MSQSQNISADIHFISLSTPQGSFQTVLFGCDLWYVGVIYVIIRKINNFRIHGKKNTNFSVKTTQSTNSRKTGILPNNSCEYSDCPAPHAHWGITNALSRMSNESRSNRDNAHNLSRQKIEIIYKMYKVYKIINKRLFQQ